MTIIKVTLKQAASEGSLNFDLMDLHVSS